MKIEAFPANIEIAVPELRELGFEKNFLDPRSGVSFNVGDITLSREGYAAMHEWWYGVNAIGSFEDPAAVVTSDTGQVYQAYLETEDMEIGYEHMTGVGLEMRKSFGHFFSKADFKTFEILASEIDPLTGKSFLDFDTLGVSCPFLIVPNNLQLAQAFAVGQVAISLYQLYSITYEILALIASLADFTFIAAAIAQGILLALFLAIALISFLDALQQMKELFFPQLRFLKAYSDFTLLNQFCKSEGYTLESNLLEVELAKLYTMGRPEAITGQSIFAFLSDEFNGSSINKGYPTAEDSTPVPGDLIDYLLETYDARITIFDSVVRLERWTTFQSQAIGEIIPTNSDQTGHDNTYILNRGEEWARMFDHLQDDYQDKHSIEANKVMKSEQLTKPINVINKDLYRLKNLKENAAPFSPAQRKNDFTRIEQTMLEVLTAFDGVIGLVGGNTNSTALVTERKGVIMIEQEYFGVAKKLWLDVDSNRIGRQPVNFQNFLSMEFIFNEYKQRLKVANNTKRVVKMTVPFTDDNFISLLQNPFMNYRGLDEAVEITYCRYIDRQYKAELQMLLPDTSGENTTTVQL